MNTQTIEDAVSTMKRSHLQLLDMAYANLKFTGSPEPPLEHLKIFKSKAEARDPTWFNVAENYQSATADALQVRHTVLDLLCDETVWQQEIVEQKVPVETVAERVFEVASLCARDEEHTCAAKLLGIYLKMSTRKYSLSNDARDTVQHAPSPASENLKDGLSIAHTILFRLKAKPPWAATFVKLCGDFTDGDLLLYATCACC
eukprot:7384012-Prymnesium_polylepis.1